MDSGDALAALTGSKRRAALVALLIAGAAVGGAFALGILGVPSVAAVDNSFGDVTNETTEVETDLTVANPNPVGVGLDGVIDEGSTDDNTTDGTDDGDDGVLPL